MILKVDNPWLKFILTDNSSKQYIIKKTYTRYRGDLFLALGKNDEENLYKYTFDMERGYKLNRLNESLFPFLK